MFKPIQSTVLIPASDSFGPCCHVSAAVCGLQCLHLNQQGDVRSNAGAAQYAWCKIEAAVSASPHPSAHCSRLSESYASTPWLLTVAGGRTGCSGAHAGLHLGRSPGQLQRLQLPAWGRQGQEGIHAIEHALHACAVAHPCLQATKHFWQSPAH